MDLDDIFYYSVIIQGRGIVFPETPAFQTTANGHRFVGVFYHLHLISEEKVKISGIFGLINPHKPVTNNRVVSVQTYADSGGEGVFFSLTTFSKPVISFFFFIVFHFKFMRLSIVSVVVVLVV